MRIARSARTCKVLGATLIALILPSLSFAAANSSGVNGIDGSSMNGIDGSSILGIDGSSIAGIDGSSVLGIDGSSIAGIDGSSVLGIDGSSIAGIDGSSVLGIDGSSIAGIDGSSALGIDGSSIAGIDGSSTTGIDGSSILLAGPVDSIDRINGVFESMGQVVMASQDMLVSMQVGDYVAVEGTVISSGWYFADAVDVSNQLYVPGSTEVFVSGVVSSVDAANGTAQMGDLTIDYTASLSSGNAPSRTSWSFRGTRPALGGMMISDRTSGASLR